MLNIFTLDISKNHVTPFDSLFSFYSKTATIKILFFVNLWNAHHENSYSEVEIYFITQMMLDIEYDS